MKLLKRSLTIVMAGIVFFSLASPVVAVSGGGIGGRPAHPDPKVPRSQSIFVYTSERGKEINDQVVVSNNSDTEQAIKIYPVDGVVTNTGAYTCKQDAESRQDVGSWVKLSTPQVTLASGQNENIDFTVTVPSNADVGEHNGCIVFEKADDKGEVAQGGAVRIKTRQAIRMVITIPGTLSRKVDITDFSYNVTASKQQYILKLENKGNVSADVDTKVQMTSLFGKNVYENGGGYPVLSNQKLDLTFDNNQKPGFGDQLFFGGWYKIQATIQYDKRAGVFGTDNKAQLITKKSSSYTVFVAPQPLALVLYAVVLLGLIGLMIWILVRHRAGRSWVAYHVSEGETLETIASKHAVKWQKLARVNKIKAPYTVRKGDSLSVPARQKNGDE